MLLVAFLAINLLTATRYPFVWVDEVQLADPAINLHLGNGFVSSTNRLQPANEFWASNVPLYSMLMYVWTGIFGMSIRAVRSLDFVLMGGTCLLIWWGCWRARLVASARLRLGMLGLICCGFSVIFAYRSARYDCLAMFLVAAMFVAHGIESYRLRLLAFFLLGLPVPWAGLQLGPLLAVYGLLLTFCLGRKFAGQMVAAACGAGLGLLSLLWFFQLHGVLPQFIHSVLGFSSVGVIQKALQGRYTHSGRLPKDFSFPFLFAGAVLLAFAHRWQGLLKLRSPLVFGLAGSVMLSVALVCAGQFPTYYGWMTYIPLSICVCAALGEARSGVLSRAAIGLTIAAAGIGVLLHGAAAIYDWKARDYGPVEQLVQASIRPTDHAYVDFPAYYAARKVAHRLYAGAYLPAFRDEEKQQLSVLVINPRNLTDVTNWIGGAWDSTGQGYKPQRALFGTDYRLGFLSMQNYELEVFRRAETKR